MGFQDDWIMRQIEMMTHFIASVVFGKKEGGITYEPGCSETYSGEPSLTDKLYYQLSRMIEEGKICEAEDVLFENIQFGDDYIRLASDFYQKLNKLSDKELEKADFSREEVCDGYIEIMALLGVPIDVFARPDTNENP